MQYSHPDFGTKATRHPQWETIRNRLALRFKDSEELEKWAVDAVSAHIMECPERAARALRMLGPLAAGDVVGICRRSSIELPV